MKLWLGFVYISDKSLFVSRIVSIPMTFGQSLKCFKRISSLNVLLAISKESNFAILLIATETPFGSMAEL